MQTEPKMPFAQFIRLAWPHIGDPNPYIHGWHIEAIADELQEMLTTGKNLLINSPPATGRSIILRVMFPAYVWSIDQSQRIAIFGYCTQWEQKQTLLKLLNSPWYQELVPRTQWFDHGAIYILNSSRGSIEYRVAGIPTCGILPHHFIVDGSHALGVMNRYSNRKTCNDWFQFSVTNRGMLHTMSVVVSESRSHSDDLSGAILKGIAEVKTTAEREKWRHICLPMRYEPAHPHKWDGDLRNVAGELLWPEAMDARKVAALVQQMQLDHNEVNIDTQLDQWPGKKKDLDNAVNEAFDELVEQRRNEDAKIKSDEPYDPSEFVPDLDQPQSVEQMASEMRAWHKNTCNWFNWRFGCANHFVARSQISRLSLTRRKKTMVLGTEMVNESNKDDLMLLVQTSGDGGNGMWIDNKDDIIRFMDWIGLPLPSKGTK